MHKRELDRKFTSMTRNLLFTNYANLKNYILAFDIENAKSLCAGIEDFESEISNLEAFAEVFQKTSLNMNKLFEIENYVNGKTNPDSYYATKTAVHDNKKYTVYRCCDDIIDALLLDIKKANCAM